MWTRVALLLSVFSLCPVVLCGCAQEPDPESWPAEVDFGLLDPGAVAYAEVELWNPGAERTVQLTVQPSSGIFSSPHSGQFTVEGGTLAAIELRALGAETGLQQGVVTLSWEGGSSEVFLSAHVEFSAVDLDHDGSPAGEDCDDSDPRIRPGAEEICDGLDTDCDGVLPAEEIDFDNDGQSPCQGDCDDNDSTAFDLSAELCDGIDNDCNGLLDFDLSGEVDVDGDGSLSCADCDDVDPANSPDLVEQCDGSDNDCSGDADADAAGEVDADADGSLSCVDCDDDPATGARNFPGNPEICDGTDNDCNGLADADAGGEQDADSDGFLSCADCDDSDAQVSPNATEICDAVDNNCDGLVDENAVFEEFFLKGIDGPAAELWRSDFSGGFSVPEAFDPASSGTVTGAVAGDFDADGHLDFILGQEGQGVRAHFYRSDCEGGFDVVNSGSGGMEFAGRSNVQTAADLDQDGDLDVLGWDFSDGEGWTWLNDGDGTTWTRVPSASNGTRPFDLRWNSGSPPGFREVVAVPPVDVDGDGYPDLVECINIASGGIALAASSCHISFGVGDGTFTSTVFPDFGVLHRLNGIALADFDGDGDIDMLGGLDDDGDAGQVWYWPGGTIYPTGLGTEAFDVNEASAGINDQAEPGYGWMSPYDWNGDGAMDVLVSYMDPHTSQDRTLVVAINDGNANFTVQSVGNSEHAHPSNHVYVQDIISVPVWP